MYMTDVQMFTDILLTLIPQTFRRRGIVFYYNTEKRFLQNIYVEFQVYFFLRVYLTTIGVNIHQHLAPYGDIIDVCHFRNTVLMKRCERIETRGWILRRDGKVGRDRFRPSKKTQFKVTVKKIFRKKLWRSGSQERGNSKGS